MIELKGAVQYSHHGTTNFWRIIQRNVKVIKKKSVEHLSKLNCSFIRNLVLRRCLIISEKFDRKSYINYLPNEEIEKEIKQIKEL